MVFSPVKSLRVFGETVKCVHEVGILELRIWGSGKEALGREMNLGTVGTGGGAGCHPGKSPGEPQLELVR